MFCWLHLTELGSQTKFNNKELKRVFLKGHTEMVDTSSLPKGTPRTAYGDSLVSKQAIHKKLILRSWREHLGWKKDSYYEN